MSDSSEFFVGLDVSKQQVEVCALDAAGRVVWREKVPRTGAAMRACGERLGPGALAVLEGTGGLERLPARALEAAGVGVVVENPQKMRYYALSHGRREKSDTLDARMLAQYALERRPCPRQRPDPRCEQLQQLTARRRQLVRLRAAEKTRLRAETNETARCSLLETIAFLSAQVDRMTAVLDELVQSSEPLRRRFALLTSAPGVGPVTALELLATLPELGDLSRGAAAKLTGLAPLVQQSGAWRGEMHVSGGRGVARRALYLAALATVRVNVYFRDVYLDLVGRGKAKKLALTAIARRLLVTLNQMLKNDRPFDPSLLPQPRS